MVGYVNNIIVSHLVHPDILQILSYYNKNNKTTKMSKNSINQVRVVLDFSKQKNFPVYLKELNQTCLL